ncbi:asparagine-linked glycosylation protein [Tilletia horrida]|nr:asparagine-linked glycosylation protein [Tilletia horrida]
MCRRARNHTRSEGESSSVPSVLVLFSLVLLTSAIALVQGIESYIRRTRRLNRKRTRSLLKSVYDECTGRKSRRSRDARSDKKDEDDEEEEGDEEYKYLNSPREDITIVGFFHPFCNAGGGGERVLFQALAHHQQQDPNTLCVVYTGDLSDTVSKHDILSRAQQRFGIPLRPSRVHFLPLHRRFLVEDGYWKHFTLLGQSLGAAILGAEAMALLVPDIFIDTMGYAFAYPVVRFFAPGIPIGAYVHYPTISTDMLERVKSRTAGHTNDASVAGSTWKTHAKLIYYHLFASAYSFSLARANTIVANSSWTKAHLDTLLFGKPHNKRAQPIPAVTGAADSAEARQDRVLRQALDARRGKKKREVEIVYPPCDTTAFSAFPLEGPAEGEEREAGLLVSLAQFRPEKEHATQIRLLRALFDLDPAFRSGGKLAAPSEAGVPKVRLVMMGSCRNEGDEARIVGLKELARELGVEDSVSFVVNAPFGEILATLSRASIGLSTMVDEHFGINVVEFMAAGLITLSHASAGPYLDIAVPVIPASGSSSPSAPQSDPQPTGFHALDPPSFAAKLRDILLLPPEEQLAIRSRARARAIECFGSHGFEEAWRGEVWEVLLRALEEVRRRRRKSKSD